MRVKNPQKDPNAMDLSAVIIFHLHFPQKYDHPMSIGDVALHYRDTEGLHLFGALIYPMPMQHRVVVHHVIVKP